MNIFNSFLTDNLVVFLVRRFAPRVTSNTDAFVILAIVFVLSILLFISKLISSKDKKISENANWKHIETLCLERRLSPHESSIVLEVLKSMNLKHPLHTITSMDVYDRLIANRIATKIGQRDATYIRKKLFLTPIASKESNDIAIAIKENEDTGKHETTMGISSVSSELPEDNIEDILQAITIDDTNDIEPGEELKLKFDNIPSMHSCGVILNDHDGLLIFLPKYKDAKIYPKVGEKVEGHYLKNDPYFFFESKVINVFKGEVVSCKITHSRLNQQIKSRKFAKAEINHLFQFFHIPASSMANQKEVDQKAPKYLCDGIIKNISAGGCAISMSPPKPTINPGDLLRFPIATPGNKTPIKVMGSVLQSNYNKDNTELLMNIKFIGLEQGTQDELVSAIFKILKSKRKK